MRFQSGVGVKKSPAKIIMSTKKSGIQRSVASSVPFLIDVAQVKEKVSGMRKYNMSIVYHTAVFWTAVLIRVINEINSSIPTNFFLIFCVFCIHVLYISITVCMIPLLWYEKTARFFIVEEVLLLYI